MRVRACGCAGLENGMKGWMDGGGRKRNTPEEKKRTGREGGRKMEGRKGERKIRVDGWMDGWMGRLYCMKEGGRVGFEHILSYALQKVKKHM